LISVEEIKLTASELTALRSASEAIRARLAQ
jgi:hypothetical protein